MKTSISFQKLFLALLSNALLAHTPLAGLTWGGEAFAQSLVKDNFTITLEGDDAEALYVRLAKKEFGGDGLDRLTTRIGQNVLCTRENVGSKIFKNYEYKCSLSFNVETGELHEMYPIGDDDSEAGLKEDKDGYQGKSVNVKPYGTEGTFTIHGIRAEELFDKMKQTEEPARIVNGKFTEVEQNEKRDGNQNGTTVTVKKGIHVTCYRATFTLAPLTECSVTLEVKNGKAKPAGEGGMNEKKKEETPPPPAAPTGPGTGTGGTAPQGSDAGNSGDGSSGAGGSGTTPSVTPPSETAPDSNDGSKGSSPDQKTP